MFKLHEELEIQRADHALTADRLASVVQINGIDFDGQQDIDIDFNLTLEGDVTGTGQGVITTQLQNTSVAQGTYTKITVDSKGRAINGSQLQSTDVTTALGFSPYDASNPAGYQTSTQVSAAITEAIESSIVTSAPVAMWARTFAFMGA